MGSLRKGRCQHPEDIRIVDPFEEGRGICGYCGEQTASKDLYEKACAQLMGAQEMGRPWERRWFRNA